MPLLIEHPDVQIAALRKELAMHPENADAIEAAIARFDLQPRPAVVLDAGSGELKGNRQEAFLAALYKERDRADGDEHRAAVQAEIDRIETHKPTLIERAVTSLPKRTQKAVKNTEE